MVVGAQAQPLWWGYGGKAPSGLVKDGSHWEASCPEAHVWGASITGLNSAHRGTLNGEGVCVLVGILYGNWKFWCFISTIKRWNKKRYLLKFLMWGAPFSEFYIFTVNFEMYWFLLCLYCMYKFYIFIIVYRFSMWSCWTALYIPG